MPRASATRRTSGSTSSSGGMHLSPRHGHDDRPGPRGRLRADRRARVGRAATTAGRRPGRDGAAGRRRPPAGDAGPTPCCSSAIASRRPRPPSPRRSSASRSPTSTAASRRWARSTTQLRHAITKLAHLHLVSSEANAPPGRSRWARTRRSVHVVGAPGLDDAFRDDLPDRAELAADLGLALEPPVVLVTVHPATLDADPAGAARAVVAAMDAVPATYVITLPNVDPGAAEVARDDRWPPPTGPRRWSRRRSASAATGACCASPTRCSATAPAG